MKRIKLVLFALLLGSSLAFAPATAFACSGKCECKTCQCGDACECKGCDCSKKE